MPDTNILCQLENNNRILDRVTDRLDNLKNLFEDKSENQFIVTVDGFIYDGSVKAKTVYQTDNVTVTVGEWSLSGDVWPEHKHTESIEYLIVFKGKAILTVGNVNRVMRQGECASLPAGVIHSCTSIEDGTSIVGICIPPEKAYLMETLKCLTSQEKS